MTRFRLPLRLTEIVAVIVALSLGYLLISHLGIQQDTARPFVRSGKVGAVVRLSYADVDVRDVRAARYLANPAPGGSVFATSDVFVVVTAKLVATQEPTTFTTAVLVDTKGRRYRLSAKTACPPTAPEGLTGVATYVMYCFEVPPQRLAQIHLEIARGSIDNNTLRDDDLADVDLGIDRADARTMADTQSAYQIDQPSREPFNLRKARVRTGSS